MVKTCAFEFSQFAVEEKALFCDFNDANARFKLVGVKECAITFFCLDTDCVKGGGFWRPEFGIFYRDCKVVIWRWLRSCDCLPFFIIKSCSF